MKEARVLPEILLLPNNGNLLQKPYDALGNVAQLFHTPFSLLALPSRVFTGQITVEGQALLCLLFRDLHN